MPQELKRGDAGSTDGPRERFTFRGNLAGTRHGWLRLTPAYSVHFVRELLADATRGKGAVLDPFCGTGTTLLALFPLFSVVWMLFWRGGIDGLLGKVRHG